MRKLLYSLLLLLPATMMFAGNPDRQGEAGAYELLLNPWARSAGLHSINVANVRGIDGLFLNPAGMSRIEGTEIGVSQSRYLTTTGITVNAFGLVTKAGKNGFLGVSLNSMNFGDIAVTTTNQPEGTGATFSPSFINIGLSYAKVFERVTVGMTFRVVSEGISDMKATGACLDAGVQYRNDNFHFGLSLRNVGTRMAYGGEGLSFSQINPDQSFNYNLTYEFRASSFEMPSQLNLGVAYDIKMGKKAKTTVNASFTSNAFSRDQIGAGAEFEILEMFTFRGAYRYDVGQTAPGIDGSQDLYTGLAGGVSAELPIKKGSGRKLGLDYSFLPTRALGHTHNIGFRLAL
jgi:hypothetical protein